MGNEGRFQTKLAYDNHIDQFLIMDAITYQYFQGWSNGKTLWTPTASLAFKYHLKQAALEHIKLLTDLDVKPEFSDDEASASNLALIHICRTHQHELMRAAQINTNDDIIRWQNLVVTVRSALLGLVMMSPRAQEKMKEDIGEIRALGCVACFFASEFKRLLQAAESQDLKEMRQLTIQWIQEYNPSI